MIGQAMLLERRTDLAATLERFVPVDSERLVRLESSIAARVLPASIDAAGTAVRLRCGARTIVALPIDTRRFVRAMACHISFN